MQNDNYIPEASEPDFYVEGCLVDPSWAHAVRTGWKAGLVWLALKAVLFALAGAWGIRPAGGLAFFVADCAVLAALIYGVYKWKLWPAAILFLYLIVSMFAAAWVPEGPQGRPMASTGMLAVAFPVVFGVFFGRAFLAIRAFRKSQA